MNWELLQHYGPRLLNGLVITVTLVAISVTIGGLLAFPIVLARRSKYFLLKSIAIAYMTFFRGTPMLAQIFLVYYGAGQFHTFMQTIGLWFFFQDAFNCAVLTFSLNTAAYQAEILRGAIQAIPQGQTEAAQTLGLKRYQIFGKIILPQAYIIALKPLGNELILMIKGSAIASVITILDLMGETRIAFSRSFDFQVYVWAGLMYLALVECIQRLWAIIELRLTRHLRLGHMRDKAL